MKRTWSPACDGRLLLVCRRAAISAPTRWIAAIALERSLRGRTVYDVTITNAAGELVGVFRGTCYRSADTVPA